MIIEQLKKEAAVDKKIEEMEGLEPVLKEKSEKEPETAKEAITEGQIPIGALQDKTAQDEEFIMIKSILSENVAEIYKQMSSLRQKAFRKRGEEVALKIKIIMQKARVKANDIFELIKNWLKMLSHLNTYFLEQEAKIKTDKILGMKKEGQQIEK